MAKTVVLGIRKGGVWFYKVDPTFGEVSLKPRVISSFKYDLLTNPDISPGLKRLLMEDYQ